MRAIVPIGLVVVLTGCGVLDKARAEKAAEEKAEAAKWKLDSATRKAGIAAVLEGGTVRSAGYHDGDARFVATVTDDGSNRKGLAGWVCQALRDEKAVGAETMRVVVESPEGKALGEHRCAHHTQAWRD